MKNIDYFHPSRINHAAGERKVQIKAWQYMLFFRIIIMISLSIAKLSEKEKYGVLNAIYVLYKLNIQLIIINSCN